MQSVTILCVGKLKEQFYDQAVREYCKRLLPFCKLNLEELPEYKLPADPTNAEIEIALEKEKSVIESRIPKGALVVALCIEGELSSSENFSKLLGQYSLNGFSKMCFIIGGSFGLSKSIKQNADYRLSMSPMTFPHHLARVMLLEQIYRAYQIASGSKYHK